MLDISHVKTSHMSVQKSDWPLHYGTKPGHFETSKIHFPTSEGVSEVSERASEQTSERSGGRERSEQFGASERVSGASERGNGRASGPVHTSLDSCLFQTTVDCSFTRSRAHGKEALVHELNASISYNFNPQCNERRDIDLDSIRWLRAWSNDLQTLAP